MGGCRSSFDDDDNSSNNGGGDAKVEIREIAIEDRIKFGGPSLGYYGG